MNDKDRPVGIIVRQDITEYFSKQYVKELKGKKPISTLMDDKPIIVDRSTGIEDVARIILDAGMAHMVSGFIITKEKKYLGMANGYDLLHEMTQRKQKHLFGLAHFDQLTGLPVAGSSESGYLGIKPCITPNLATLYRFGWI